MVLKFEINGIKCISYRQVLRVKDSYRMKCKDAKEFCERAKARTTWKYNRSAHEWTRELIAHIILYRLHLFRKHVTDTDLDERESRFRKMCYTGIYAVYSIASAIKAVRKQEMD